MGDDLGGRLRVLGDRLGAFRDGVLGEFTGQDQTDGGLDLARRQRRLGVVARKAPGLKRNALEDVVDERVHDGHGTTRDTRVRVDLLQDLVDVRRVRLDALLVALRALAGLLRRLAGGLGRTRGLLWRHGSLVWLRTLMSHDHTHNTVMTATAARLSASITDIRRRGGGQGCATPLGAPRVRAPNSTARLAPEGHKPAPTNRFPVRIAARQNPHGRD